MSENNKPASSSRPQRGQDFHQPKGTRYIREGYQPTTGKFSPKTPPSNPPKIGKSSGKK